MTKPMKPPRSGLVLFLYYAVCWICHFHFSWTDISGLRFKLLALPIKSSSFV